MDRFFTAFPDKTSGMKKNNENTNWKNKKKHLLYFPQSIIIMGIYITFASSIRSTTAAELKGILPSTLHKLINIECEPYIKTLKKKDEHILYNNQSSIITQEIHDTYPDIIITCHRMLVRGSLKNCWLVATLEGDGSGS